MAPQTVQASQAGIQKAELLRQELGWTQYDLADKSGASRNVVINFLKGRPVRLDLFKCICQALEQRADWKTYAELNNDKKTKKFTPQSQEPVSVDVEGVVYQLRKHTKGSNNTEALIQLLREQIKDSSQSNNFTQNLSKVTSLVNEQRHYIENLKKFTEKEKLNDTFDRKEAREEKYKSQNRIEDIAQKLSLHVEELAQLLHRRIIDLVQQIREQVAPDIQRRCGLIRVLDMTQPIDSTAIYTDVNILERVTSKTRSDLVNLMQGMKADNFDRFCLGKVREERVPGLEALSRHKLLMILGKPGAGKTTFLKRLAMWGKVGQKGLEGQVPLFITLKELADDRWKYDELIDFIADSYALKSERNNLEILLKSGKALVLLDGLDEVKDADNGRVLRAIREFSQSYSHNQIVITCRIAAREYIFQEFTEVEIADFHDSQIQDFAEKWFLAHRPEQVDKNGESKIKKLFWQELEQNKPVKELATNPLLLTLLCLEFGEDCCFPSSRAELYERGLELLFTKWDGTRQIQRDQVYKKLPVMRKKALLAQLAWSIFIKGDYFFKQIIAENLIRRYIQNLPGASQAEEALLLDSKAVLNTIEAQHGLLTERAVGIYSFSHRYCSGLKRLEDFPVRSEV